MAFWLKALPTTSTWSTLRTSREADSTLRNVLSRTSSLAESDTWRPENSSKYILETEKGKYGNLDVEDVWLCCWQGSAASLARLSSARKDWKAGNKNISIQVQLILQVIDSPPKDHLQGGLNVDSPKQDRVHIPPVKLSLAPTPTISMICIMRALNNMHKVIVIRWHCILCALAIAGNVCMHMSH